MGSPSVGLLHRSHGLQAQRVQLSVSSCGTETPVTRRYLTWTRHNSAHLSVWVSVWVSVCALSPNCSCVTSQLNTSSPLTTSCTRLRSRVSSRTQRCPRAVRAAAGRLGRAQTRDLPAQVSGADGVQVCGQMGLTLQTLQAGQPVSDHPVRLVRPVEKSHSCVSGHFVCHGYRHHGNRHAPLNCCNASPFTNTDTCPPHKHSEEI